jgi:hypothetical protein
MPPGCEVRLTEGSAEDSSPFSGVAGAIFDKLQRGFATTPRRKNIPTGLPRFGTYACTRGIPIYSKFN